MAGYDFEFYETGKISVTAGQKAFTGTGTAWKLRGCEGALVIVVGAGAVNFVSSLSTDAAGEFRTAWAGPTLANASYVMWLPSAVAATALANHQKLAEIIASIQMAQPANDKLSALAALAFVADRIIYSTGDKTFATSAISSLARSFLAEATGGAMWSRMGGVTLDSANSGYFKLPDARGTIIQRGIYWTGNGTAITFPMAFPNAVRMVLASMASRPNGDTPLIVMTGGESLTGFTAYTRNAANGATVTATIYWEAIGH
ncbi:hypothetical protein ACI50E_16855 [Brucella sp. ZJ1_1]|uniref:gp53-like domain-containing protein n=1 Tax=Brucella sp. ZJ1_1 TaxID=3379097 RepID=UPI0038531FC1